jgi:hypothetical protein
MSKLNLHPRLVALLTVVGGAAVIAILAALGLMNLNGRGSTKVIFLVGMAGIAAGVGLTQLLWPPKRPAEGDERGGWQLAPWPQKILWIFGGCVGVLGASIATVVLGGGY